MKKIFVVVFVILVLAAFITMLLPDESSEILRSDAYITKVEMKVVSEKVKYITITDPKVLDSLTLMLRQSSEIDVQRGGVFKILADVNVYKGTDHANFAVLFSEYHGWYVETSKKTLKCDYLFGLVNDMLNKIKSQFSLIQGLKLKNLLIIH